MRQFCYLLLFLALSCQGYSNPDLVNYSKPLETLLDSLDISPSELHLFIDKTDYVLSVMQASCVIKQYPVVLGGNPTDDKLMQGDQCTPEGRFSILSKYPHRTWEKFIWIDYPNQDSWKKHNAAKSGGMIPEDASIGGEIGIHGVPEFGEDAIALGINWTLGCISLRNDDINDFYRFIDKGTLVIIQK